MAQTCPQCQSEAADEAAYCPSCGSSLRSDAGPAATASDVGAPAGAGASAGAPAAPAPSSSSLPAYKFDAARWSLADRIAGVATVVLFVSLFLTWFSVTVGNSVVSFSVSVDGLSAHGYLYLVMILCILIVAYLALRAGWDRLPIDANLPHLTVMLVATLVNLLLVLIAFFSTPGSGWGWSIGAFLALFAAIVAAAPYAVPQLRAKTM